MLVTRASLLVELGRPSEARADLERAISLAPEAEDPRLALAGLDLAEGRPDDALERLTGPEGGRAHSPAAWFLRARAFEALGAPREALAAGQTGLELRSPPLLEDYLQVSELSRAAGDAAHASRVLEEGLSRLGPVPALLEAAFTLDLARGDVTAALGRLDAQDPNRNRPDLLARRGDLLLACGREPEAWVEFTEARAALDRLPPPRRSAPAYVALAARLDAALRNEPQETSP